MFDYTVVAAVIIGAIDGLDTVEQLRNEQMAGYLNVEFDEL